LARNKADPVPSCDEAIDVSRWQVGGMSLKTLSNLGATVLEDGTLTAKTVYVEKDKGLLIMCRFPPYSDV
jgi:hypothetical protein